MPRKGEGTMPVYELCRKVFVRLLRQRSEALYNANRNVMLNVSAGTKL